MVKTIVTKQDLKNYKENGWIVFKKVFKKNEIQKYKNNIFKYLKTNHKKFKGRNINYFDNKKTFSEISSFHKLQENKKIKKFSESSVVSLIAKKLLNKKPDLRASELFIKKRGAGKPTPIHQDAYYWNVKNNEGLTVWIALTDSNKKNGSVFYFDKSHKCGVFKHKSSFVKGSSQKIMNETMLNKFSKSTPNVKKGDVIVHNSLSVHGSFKNISNRRRIGWTFCYKPKSSPYDIKRTKKFEKKLFHQIKLREK